MTDRDELAARAMQAMLTRDGAFGTKELAAKAYAFADAMHTQQEDKEKSKTARLMFVDDFETPAQRITAYPTMREYCEASSEINLRRLIWDRMHQGEVFGTYPGSNGDHSAEIIRAASVL